MCSPDPIPPCSTAYSLSNGAIGSQVSQQTLVLPSPYENDVMVPTGLTVLANTSAISGNAVFVTAYDQSAYNPGCTPTPTCASSTANPGWAFGFSIGSGGALQSPPAALIKPVKPSGIASTPTNEYVYVTDYADSELIAFSVRDGVTLIPLINGPFKTGSLPTAIVIDPRGKYIYVADSISNSGSGGGAVSIFVIDLGTGTPSAEAGTGNSTNTDPVAITVDAGVGTFVYTANYEDNSISGFDLSVDSGELTTNQALTLSLRIGTPCNHHNPRRATTRFVDGNPVTARCSTTEKPSRAAGLFCCVKKPLSPHHFLNCRCAGFSIKCSASSASPINVT